MNDNSIFEISIIIGSKSDLDLAKETIKLLKDFRVSYNLNIASAHRTPEYLKNCIKKSEKQGAKVFIAIAGLSAALPGVIASETILPVIGVPVNGQSLLGFDSLLSIVQMPRGVPVATVTVGKTGANNAAILALQILATNNESLKKELVIYRKKINEEILKENDIVL
ncbi:MAG: 5-(carboxyamino)imidazole ribonucleotide mutase [Endomicrobium sp.]|jgi:5-(carboxyamino)imidazole ribonucleotide mutase|nr:5-(carboxyamino)imidazole ribonucleotide mutase [Endomicrobium sp.]